MSKVTTEPGATAKEAPNAGFVDSMTGTLDEWRARIDELMVQADLAKLDVREQATKQLEIAQNACLAAYASLRDAGRDATTNVDTFRDGVQKLLQDVKAAFDAAQAVIGGAESGLATGTRQALSDRSPGRPALDDPLSLWSMMSANLA